MSELTREEERGINEHDLCWARNTIADFQAFTGRGTGAERFYGEYKEEYLRLSKIWDYKAAKKIFHEDLGHPMPEGS